MSHTAYCFLYPHAHRVDARDRARPIELSAERKRAGLRAVLTSLLILVITSLMQALVFVISGSVALFADVAHNVGDALTAVPVGAGFLLMSRKAERFSGLGVVVAIFISACVAGYAATERLINPRPLTNLLPLAIAGVIGVVGNWIAAGVRNRAGERLNSAALIADGAHAAADAYASLTVVLSAGLVAAGMPLADPLLALAVTGFILHITWEAWHTVRH
jgi:cation diffusion facilitator family transporter